APRAQHRRVELLRVCVEGVGAASLRETAGLDEVADGVALLAPALGVVTGELAFLDEPERAVEGHPARELRDRVVAQVGQLPDPRVLVAPDHAEAVDRVGQAAAGGVVELVALANVEVGRLEEVAPGAELELRARRVALGNGPRGAIASQLRR